MFKEIQHNKLTELESTSVHLKSSLTNNSKDTSTSNLETLDVKSSTSPSVNNSINSTKHFQERLPMLENILDTEGAAVETQSSEKENLDDINHWFNDGLEYEDFEMVNFETECIPTPTDPTNNCDISSPANVVVSIVNTETTVATVSDVANTSTVTTSTVETNTTTSERVGIMSRAEKVTSDMKSQGYSIKGNEEKLLCDESPKTQKQLVKTSRKQMDIGVYFGLKPKHKVAKNKVEDVSSKVLQQKEVMNEQCTTQCSVGKTTSQTKKCPFYKIVDGKD